MPLFSYAAPDDGPLKRLAIQSIERLTGQPRLKRMYEHYRAHPQEGESFWDAAVRYLQLRVRVSGEPLESLPASGPLVVVANHPYGVLDGIVISQLISRVRPDFRILTNNVLYRAPEVRPWLLPIDFSQTREALETNLASRAAARRHLTEGSVLIVFPGGTVSTAPNPFGRAVDPEWGPFTARLIMAAKCPVVPMFFEGQNSRLFQIASHISETLRLSLLFKEVSGRIGSDLNVRIGRPVPFAELAHLGGRRQLASHLRTLTYGLAT